MSENEYQKGRNLKSLFQKIEKSARQNEKNQSLFEEIEKDEQKTFDDARKRLFSKVKKKRASNMKLFDKTAIDY